MSWFRRARKAINAACSAYNEPLVPPAPDSPAPLPAAFRPPSLPQLDRKALHFYTARDWSNDPKSPYQFLRGHSTGHLNNEGLFYRGVRTIAPVHVKAHYDWALANSADGHWSMPRYGSQKFPYHHDSFEYEVITVNGEVILVAVHSNLDVLERMPNNWLRKRTYVTRFPLPHPLFKHKHTLTLSDALTSQLSIWEGVND